MPLMRQCANDAVQRSDATLARTLQLFMNMAYAAPRKATPVAPARSIRLAIFSPKKCGTDAWRPYIAAARGPADTAKSPIRPGSACREGGRGLDRVEGAETDRLSASRSPVSRRCRAAEQPVDERGGVDPVGLSFGGLAWRGTRSRTARRVHPVDRPRTALGFPTTPSPTRRRSLATSRPCPSCTPKRGWRWRSRRSS